MRSTGVSVMRVAGVLAREVDDGWLVSAALNNLGSLYLSERAYERAIELFEESLAIGEARGDLSTGARGSSRTSATRSVGSEISLGHAPTSAVG